MTQDSTTNPDVFADDWVPADRGQWRPEPAPVPAPVRPAFLLGRAISIIEGLIESPTDALDIQMARDLLADYRRWRES